MLSPILVDFILFVLGAVFGRYLGFIFGLTPSYIDYLIKININKFIAVFLGFVVTIFLFSLYMILILFLVIMIGRENLTQEGKFVLFFGMILGMRFFTYKPKVK
ncbi:hypothetical protein [Acinetobacter bereziniae]|uniref:hypothetical protein n=1 Tax=Acinetobacter bereziniae TaxID=106648 RepID=UPI00125FBE9F|nr:hypothetical protein [Acinetobacter bereziniae]